MVSNKFEKTRNYNKSLAEKVPHLATVEWNGHSCDQMSQITYQPVANPQPSFVIPVTLLHKKRLIFDLVSKKK